MHLRDQLRELYHVVAYVEATSDVTLPDGGAEQDIVSAGAFTYGGFPTYIEFFCPRVDSPADGGFTLSLWDGGTELGDLWTDAAAARLGTIGSDQLWPHGVYLRTPTITPSAASHTYKISGRAYNATGSDVVTLQAGSAGANLYYPIYIRVWERGG